MANPFDIFLTMARTYGIYEFYLPFLLVLTLFYGLLQKTKIFGEGMKGLNLIVAVIAAMYVMVYSPVAITITEFFSRFFTQTSIVFVTLLVGMMIIGLLPGLSGENWKTFWEDKKIGPLTFILILIGIGIFVMSGGPQLFGEVNVITGLSTEDIVVIVLVLATIAVIWYMVREPKEKTKGEKSD